MRIEIHETVMMEHAFFDIASNSCFMDMFPAAYAKIIFLVYIYIDVYAVVYKRVDFPGKMHTYHNV
jgi:hypothetical protein